MKLYANYQNAKAIFSEACTSTLIFLQQPHVLWALFRHAAIFNILSPDFTEWSSDWLFPSALGFIPRYFFLVWDEYPFRDFPKGVYLFNINHIEWFCVISFKKKKTFNYLKTKMLLYESIPAVLKALTSWHAINYMKELFIVSLNPYLPFSWAVY